METLFKTPIFSLVRETVGDMMVLRIQAPEWVNIMALDDRDRLLLIRQWRHGINKVTLEIPGGLVDETDKTPLAAARRELMEETGFSSTDWEELGWVHANPAYQNNRCIFFIARNAKKTGETAFDEGEEILSAEFLPLQEVYEKIRTSEISNSMVVAALGHYVMKRLVK